MQENADAIVRYSRLSIIDSGLFDQLISVFKNNDLDYCSIREHETYPDGLDVEVIRFGALQKAHENAVDQFDREHVTPFIIRSDIFKQDRVQNDTDFSMHRWTLDLKNFEVIQGIFSMMAPDIYFDWGTVELQDTNPEIFMKNKDIERNDGLKSSGIKLWERAKKVIPGGACFFQA